MSWLTRLRNVFRPDQVSAELDREMTFHIAERAEALEAQGMDPDAARLEARRRFGNYGQQKESTRERDLLVWLDTLLADLRYAVRALIKAPGFAAVAIVSLALGIGANTAIFTLLNIAMFKPLPVSHPEELVELTISGGPASKGPARFSQRLWEELRDRQDIFAGVLAYGSTGSADLSTGGEARPIAVGLVTGGFFSTLGVRAVSGRTLVDADDRPGCGGVAVLTHGFWQSEYGGARDVIGRSVAINNQPFLILGIAEPGFTGIDHGYDAPVWAPQCAGIILRGAGNYSGGGAVVARLKPGSTLEQSRARLALLAPALLEATVPAGASGPAAEQYRNLKLGVSSFSRGFPFLQMQYGEALLVLMGLAGVVLLVACANVANLLLARATARQRELAVRLALGAGRLRIIRQVLTESLLLSLLGALLGIGVAAWGSRVLVGLLSRQGRVALDLSPDAMVLGFTVAVGVLTGVLFGLAPALRAVRVDPQAAMQPGARGTVQGHSRFALGKGLVVAQVALSLVMITGAGLLLGSWRRLSSLEPGFRPEGVLLVRANSRPAGSAPERLAETYRAILDRMRALPSVTVASAAGTTPFGNADASTSIEVEGFTPIAESESRVRVNQVSEGFFASIGAELVAGRDFTPADAGATPRVAVVSEELGRRFFRDPTPVGRRFRVQGSSTPIEIIGVARDVKERSLREANQPTMYYALRQMTEPWVEMSFALRTEGNPGLLASGAKAVLAELAPRFTLTIGTLQEQVDRSVQLPRTLGMLSGFFGGLALLLAAIGLYGIMAYSVARRRNEIGVRIALGAAEGRIVGMVLGDVGRMVGAGIAIGVGLSLVVTRLIATFLFGVKPGDPATLAGAALALAAVGVGAALLPARRAARLDPVAALRGE
jgi:putative ABC transport system permease protein